VPEPDSCTATEDVHGCNDLLVGARDALGFARRKHADQHGGDVRSGVGRLEAIAVLALLESLVLFKRGGKRKAVLLAFRALLSRRDGRAEGRARRLTS
jgi:hypothetical protein